MTTTQLQLRRDTATNIAGITPAQGEPLYDATNDRLVMGDGATAERSRVLEGFCPVTCNRWFGTIPKSANVYGPFSFSVWGTPPRAQI